MSAFLAKRTALHPNSTGLVEVREVRGDPPSISRKDNTAPFLALVIFAFLSLSEVSGESACEAI
jgi:hypothetical protein